MDTFVLKVTETSGRTYRVPLGRFPFTIGRGSENDLSLACSSVSRRHASIEKKGNDLIIVDQNSRNRVFVNGGRITRHQLSSGDRIRIGSVDLQLLTGPAIKIPSASRTSEATYFPHKKSWDPVETLSSSMQVSEAAPSRKTPDWESLLRISVGSDSSEVFETVLDTIEETTPFSRCFLILFDDGSVESPRPVAQRIRMPGRSRDASTSEIYVSREILRRVAEKMEAVLVSSDDMQLSTRESFIRTGAGTALCLPLVVRGDVIGVLYIDRMPHVSPFTHEDVEALGPVAGIVALKVDNIQLLDAYLASELQKRELEIAEKVQQSLYPRDPVEVPGYSVEGFSRPCYQVGGDYFDFFPQDDGLTWVLGDVSGKGLSSALYMVSVLSALRAHIKDGISIDVLMSRLESHVRETFRPDHFLTLFLARLDAARGVLTYCNAGHIAPVVLQADGGTIELECADPALNILPWPKFRRFECRLSPGDLLVAYTDGLIEGQGKNGEQFGRERALSSIRRLRDRNLVSVRRKVLAELDDFTTDDGLHDDVTVVLVRREGETSELDAHDPRLTA